MDMKPTGETVAVVGTGPAGLSAIKHLRDIGFRVTAFEQRAGVGGLWCFSDNPKHTSATAGTKYQVSKYITSMTDYPYPDEFPTYLGPEELSTYYDSYARQFDLYPHIKFNTRISSIRRSPDDTEWLVFIEGEDVSRRFHKIVWATGTETVAKPYNIEGMENFQGQLIHGQAYKKAEDFHNKRVILLGIGNSAGDNAVELTSYASKVYLAHRRGTIIVPRLENGRPVDARLSWSLACIMFWLETYIPSMYYRIIDGVFKNAMRQAWGPMPKSWGFEPLPKTGTGLIIPKISDQLIPKIREGAIISVPGIRRIVGANSVELDNGEVLESIDAIIACTGYVSDFGALKTIINMTSDAPFTPIPQLYMNVFPPRYANSIACVNSIQFTQSAAPLRELVAMAVAQIWTGKSALPSMPQMEAEIQLYESWFAHRRKECPSIYDGWVQPDKFLRWLHKAAGTGLFERSSWFNWASWKFWWQDRELYRLVMNGVMSPHLYRLFETGKRPVWDGARDAIVEVNKQRERDYPRKS